MKKNLYIDFDGVVLDTIERLYKAIKEKDPELYERNIVKRGIINDEDTQSILAIMKGIDWAHLLKTTPEINNSIKNINYLVETNKFDIAILSHVSSYQEMEAKFDFINKHIHGEVDVICVPKSFPKTSATRNCKEAILIDDHSNNLRNWIKQGGIGVKFSKEKRNHAEFTCISSLKEIANLF